MYTNLTLFLRSFVNFTDEEIAYILSFFKSKHYKKFDKIFNCGEIARNMYFINKGLVRIYYVAPEKDITLDIIKENEWFSDYLSLMDEHETDYDAEAIEDTELFYITYEDMQRLFSRGPHFERYGRLHVEMVFLQFLMAETAGKIRNATERYLLFEQMRPEIFERAPLKYIADMLGIDQGTLSRIRKKIAQQSEQIKPVTNT